jgi:hypothetical protein
MRILSVVLALGLVASAEAATRYRGPVLLWDGQKKAYRTLKPSEVRTLKRKKALTEADLQGSLGIDPQTGEVTNPSVSDYNLELDTWTGYLVESKKLKVGPSLVVYRLDEELKLNLDVAEQFVGGSVNYDTTELLRPSIGVGYGRDFGSRTNQVYGKVSFRIW